MRATCPNVVFVVMDVATDRDDACAGLLRTMAGRGTIAFDGADPKLALLVSRGLAERCSQGLTLSAAGWRMLKDLDRDLYLD